MSTGSRLVRAKRSREGIQRIRRAYRADLIRITHGDANPDRSRMTAELRSGSQAAHDSGRGGFLGWFDYVLRQLSHNNYQNNISRMLENVLRRFLTK